MRPLIIISCFLLLTACVTTDQANQRINAWKGVTLDDLINAWGVPTKEQEIAERKFYIWSNKDESSTPAISISTGSFGRSGGISIGTIFGGGSDTDFCSRVVEVEPVSGNIKTIQWTGDPELCYELTPKRLPKVPAIDDDLDN